MYPNNRYSNHGGRYPLNNPNNNNNNEPDTGGSPFGDPFTVEEYGPSLPDSQPLLPQYTVPVTSMPLPFSEKDYHAPPVTFNQDPTLPPSGFYFQNNMESNAPRRQPRRYKTSM
jgi:hypothetical protein